MSGDTENLKKTAPLEISTQLGQAVVKLVKADEVKQGCLD